MRPHSVGRGAQSGCSAAWLILIFFLGGLLAGFSFYILLCLSCRIHSGGHSPGETPPPSRLPLPFPFFWRYCCLGGTAGPQRGFGRAGEGLALAVSPSLSTLDSKCWEGLLGEENSSALPEVGSQEGNLGLRVSRQQRYIDALTARTSGWDRIWGQELHRGGQVKVRSLG